MLAPRRFLLAASSLFALSTGGQALADTYTLLIYESPGELALRNDKGPKGKAYWDGYARFGEEARKAGVIRGGGVFVTGEAVRNVTQRNGAASVESAGGDEPRLGGNFVLEVADLKTAEEWAAKIPAARTGRITIHPQARTPGMMPAK